MCEQFVQKTVSGGITEGTHCPQPPNHLILYSPTYFILLSINYRKTIFIETTVKEKLDQ